MSEITHDMIRGMHRAFLGLRTTINWQTQRGHVIQRDFAWLWSRLAQGKQTLWAWDRSLGALVYYSPRR